MQKALLKAAAGKRSFLLLACLLGSAWQCWSATPVGERPTLPEATSLQPGDYAWSPQLSPAGPTLIVISLPEQLAYVYRNGIRIGVSTVSTGKEGHRTPTGVFTILQKHREHYSNLYDDAPMPFMQRLTWDGVALHAGTLPGYPASHGCVRLPYAFSEKVFDVTSSGTTVVITDSRLAAPNFVAPNVLASVMPSAPPLPAASDPLRESGFVWSDAMPAEGPVSIVLSVLDQHVVVFRNGIEIAHAPVRISGAPPRGTRAYMVLEGSSNAPSSLVPGRPALRWFSVTTPEKQDGGNTPQALASTGRLAVSPEFARRVYDQLTPGATLVVTDENIRPGTHTQSTILHADTPASVPAAESVHD